MAPRQREPDDADDEPFGNMVREGLQYGETRALWRSRRANCGEPEVEGEIDRKP